MEWFLHNGGTSARLVRTLVEVALAWIVANIGDIFSLFSIDSSLKAILVSALTVIFTALLGFINDNREKMKDDSNGSV